MGKPLMPLQVFVVEDNQGDVLLIRMALDYRQVSHHLTVARDGSEAIEIIRTMGREQGPPCPDIMLLDLNLPKDDGLAVISAFREHPECVQTPVIVVTSTAARREVAQLDQLGVKHYFQKPHDFYEYMALGNLVADVAGSGKA
jgi:CheY-like chemotaxis protein